MPKKLLLQRFSLGIIISLIFGSFFAAGNASATFSDIPNTHPQAASIDFLSQSSRQIIDGYSDGSFRPENSLNRAELAKMITIAGGKSIQENYSKKCFTDMDSSAWYAQYVCGAKILGFVSGDAGAGKTYRPSDTLTFAESLAALSKVFNWEIDNAKVARIWYAPLSTYAKEKNLLKTWISPTAQINRASFAELLARSIALKELGLTAFENGEEAEIYSRLGKSFLMNASDCLANEKLDSANQICEIDCGEDCTTVAETIATRANEVGANFYSGSKKFKDNAEQTSGILVDYPVSAGELQISEATTYSTNSLAQATDKHTAIWDLVKHFFPKSHLTYITDFNIITDGEGNEFGSGIPASYAFPKPMINVDIADVYLGSSNTLDKNNLIYAILHGLAHPTLLEIYTETQDHDMVYTSNENRLQLLPAKRAACLPNYYSAWSCTKDYSYLNLFYQKFWSGISATTPHIFPENNLSEAEIVIATNALYQKYPNSFVTAYAARNPAEDIAESWVAFILKNKPIGNSIADQKILFFYDYPNMLSMRNFLRGRLLEE
ncbi:MAG: S-layer homology domain-containing protein [Candidatus Gracilibacteria bacterium]|jgi:hypothetical protein